MKTKIFLFTLFLILQTSKLLTGTDNKLSIPDFSVLPAKSIFLQSNNVHTVIRTDGILNYDRVTLPYSSGGFIWPSSASYRLAMIFASGFWVGAKVMLPGNQKDLRVAASFYNSHLQSSNSLKARLLLYHEPL